MNNIFDEFFGKSSYDKLLEHQETASKWMGMIRFRCPHCGQYFGVEEGLTEEFRQGKPVWCPQGHKLRKKKE